MNDRAFGVEIEFDSNGNDIGGTAAALCKAFDRYGHRRWHFTRRMHEDGSDLELVTPILRGKRGFEKLNIVMDTMLDIGCYTTDQDGLHVHHDAPEFVNNVGNCIRLVKSWYANRHIIYEFVDHERVFGWNGSEGSHWACPGWRPKDIETFERTKEIPGWDRNDLNLHALNKHGTIEFRLHEGTLDFSEAKSWIEFGQSLLNHTIEHAVRTSDDATHLLKKIKVSPTATKKLVDKSKRR